MSAPVLPDITGIQQVHLGPGDGLIVRLADRNVNAQTAAYAREHVIANLGLPGDAPVLVVPAHTDVIHVTVTPGRGPAGENTAVLATLALPSQDPAAGDRSVAWAST